MPSIEMKGAAAVSPPRDAGESAVLLHGTASSSGQWRDLIQALPRELAVLAPDLLGYGGGPSWSGEGAFSLAAEAALVESALESNRGPLYLVGHSYGGAVALRIAADRPERIASLVLIEPVAFHLLRGAETGSQDGRLFAELLETAEVIWRAAASGGYRDAMRRFVDYWNGAGAWQQATPEQQAALVGRLPKVALDYWAALGETTPQAAYRRISAPALVLYGSCSPAPAQRLASLVADLLPDCRLEPIEGAGHMLPLTHRQAVNAAILDHLRRHRRKQDRPAA